MPFRPRCALCDLVANVLFLVELEEQLSRTLLAILAFCLGQTRLASGAAWQHYRRSTLVLHAQSQCGHDSWPLYW